MSVIKWTAYAVDGGAAWQGTWWPASGNRNNSSAALQYVAFGSYYWSASRCPSYAYYSYNLTFYYDGGVIPNNNFNRNFGFPVRCIAE